jgi:hypothetical protein
VGEKYLPVGGRVRKLRAVGDQSAPIHEEETSKLGRCGAGACGAFFAPGARALRRTPLDGRNQNSTRPCLAEDLVGEMRQEKTPCTLSPRLCIQLTHLGQAAPHALDLFSAALY